MTRKCVLCKETNYKNTYSFFSAPKDPEIRKKWQEALNIEDYSVNDETYVCSKHFDKNDIITHWISGVPPHVITIKYKKFRLRPGAVPNRNINDTSNVQYIEDDSSNMHEDDRNYIFETENNLLQETVGKGQTYLRQENKNNREFKNSGKIKSFKIKTKSEEDECMDDDPSQSNKMKMNIDYISLNDPLEISDGNESGTHCSNDAVYKNFQEQENAAQKLSSKEIYKTFKDDSFVYLKISDNGETTELWDETKLKLTKENEVSDLLEESYVKNQLKDIKEEDDDSLSNQADTNILFEDLLEVCTEAALPPGWTCIVTSKGHSTTIAYLFMSMTKTGMPFTTKQVFINSDMILRCSATNREINVLQHNLLKDSKRNKVRSLMDVEEFIDEFDQRIICEGVYHGEGILETQPQGLAYNDGINLRHISCPLIVNNDSSRCSKCTALARHITQKSKPLSTLYFPANYNTFNTKQQKRKTKLQRVVKRVRECDRRCEFVKDLQQK